MRKPQFRGKFKEALKCAINESGTAKNSFFVVVGYLQRDFPQEAALIAEMLQRPDMAAEIRSKAGAKA